jgi:hypothetical protein
MSSRALITGITEHDGHHLVFRPSLADKPRGVASHAPDGLRREAAVSFLIRSMLEPDLAQAGDHGALVPPLDRP